MGLKSRKGLLRQHAFYMKEESSSMSTETAPVLRLNHARSLKLTYHAYHAKSRFGQAIFMFIEVRRNLLLLLKLRVCF